MNEIILDVTNKQLKKLVEGAEFFLSRFLNRNKKTKKDDHVLEEIHEKCQEFIEKATNIRKNNSTEFKFYFGDFELDCPYGIKNKCDKIRLMRFDWMIPPEKRTPEAIICNNCLISQSLKEVRK